MEYFLKKNNNNNTNNTKISNFNQNYGDNKRHIYQPSMMTENTLHSNDPDPVFAEFVDTENQLMELMKKKTNDANWDLLEKLLEDGIEYEEALDQVYKRDNKNKTNDKNDIISNIQTTANRSFRHSSPSPHNIKWNSTLNEERSFTHCSPEPKNIDWNATLNEEIPNRRDMSYNVKKETRNSISFGDFISSNNNFINANDNEKYDPHRSKRTLNSSITNSDNRDIFQRSEIVKQDLSRYQNESFKRSEIRTHNYQNYKDDNREFSDYQRHELSYADRRKLNIFLDDGHKYEEALSYVLKHKDEKPTHTVTQSYQNTSFETSNNIEFDNQNRRRTSEIDTTRNRSYEEDIDNDGVALIDEEIKRKRAELELYENRLLRYSQKLIKTESKSSRSSSRDKREDDNFSIDSPEKKRLLSGAGRKRLRMLIAERGITYDKALSIVLNERMERERRTGRRDDGNIKRENIDNRNDINDIRSKRRRIVDDIREDYVTTEDMSQHDESEYDHSEEHSHYSKSQDRDTEVQRDQFRIKRFEQNERVKPLSGAGRKRIAKLVQGGMPIEEARAIVVQERDDRYARLNANVQLNESHSYKNIKLKKFKKEQLSSHGIKVYIHNKNYPNEQLDNDELDILKRAILYELDRVSPREPVVRFLSCVFKLGWLQIICADDYSCDWLANKMKTLRPWRGASLKMIVPGQSTVLVHIMEPDSCHKILDNLKKQNQGLNTENWIVLRVIHTKKGNLYIFDIDDFSLETLDSNNLTAFYGLGTVKFRLKNFAAKKKDVPFESTESRQRNTQKPFTQRHLPGKRESVDFSQHYIH